MSRIWYEDNKHGWLLGNIVSGTTSTGYDIVSAECNPNAGEKMEGVSAKSCRDWDPSHMSDDICDLSDCNMLSEAPLLDVLRRRFLKKKPDVYTYVSDIVVAINPYKYFDHLTQMETPLKRFKLKEDPHVWAIADFAYKGLLGTSMIPPESQSVVISGESGAGKTVSCNNVMKYLTCLSQEQTVFLEKKRGRRSSIADVCIEDKIMACNPFLEAFGNATTTRNNNSSRFGRYTKILYDTGRIIGAKMEDYLLEKSRVVHQPTGNRNYHAFHFLIEGADKDLRSELQLNRDPEFYRYTQGPEGEAPVTPAGTPELQRKADKEGFEEIQKCLRIAGLNSKGQLFLWKILTAILEMGNIEFEERKSNKVGKTTVVALKSDGNDVPRAVRHVSELLGLEVNGKTGLISLLLHQVISNPGRNEPDIFAEYETIREARSAVDALAKQMYHDVFKFIVALTNNALLPRREPPSGGKFIGVLDIFGFEIFKVNSFSQLLINYANEMLQSLFNEHIFKREVELYKEEKLQIDEVVFKDNAPCCRLIDASYGRHKFHGILSLLDDATLRPTPPSDFEWGKTLKTFFFEKPKKLAVKPATYLQLKKVGNGDKRKTAKQQQRIAFNGKAFWVDHYAGPVGYSTVGFLSKNLDKVPDQLMKMLMASKDSAVSSLAGISTGIGDSRGLFNLLDVKETVQTKHKDSPVESNKKSRKSKRVSQSKKGKATIASQFRKALNTLANTIRKTQPHYVRCVQPNNLKLAAGAGSQWESFDGVKILGQLVRAGLMETIEIRKRGYPFRQSYVTLWDTFQETGVLKMLKTSQQSEIMSKDEERDQYSNHVTRTPGTLVMKYTLGEEGAKLWSQGKTMLFGKDSLMRTVDEWRQRQCADIIQSWTRFQILRARTKELDQAVGGLQRLWKRELQRRKARKIAAECARVALVAYNDVMRKMKIMYEELNQSKARREAEMNASRAASAAASDANCALETTNTVIRLSKARREAEMNASRAANAAASDANRALETVNKAIEAAMEERRRRRESADRKTRLLQEEEDRRREVLRKEKQAQMKKQAEKERKEMEEEKKKQAKLEEERQHQQQQEQRAAPGVMVRQKSKREKLLDKLAKNRQKSGRGLRQTSGRGLRQTSKRSLKNENQATEEQQQEIPGRQRKMTGKEALAMAFRSGSVSSRDSEPQGSMMTPPPGIEFKRRHTATPKNIARRQRRFELVMRLFNKVEEEYLDKKAEREDVFDAKGEIRFECAKTDKLGIRRRRSVILNKKRGVIRTLRPGGKEAKQLAVQRIVSVRQDTETQCRIVFGSLDEKRKKQKRAHRPYELLFDSPNELKRFLQSLQVVRESAPKRGMSVMEMERLGSFMNLENSVFGTAKSVADFSNVGGVDKVASNSAMAGREGFDEIKTSKGKRWIQIRFSVIKTNRHGAEQERLLTFRSSEDPMLRGHLQGGGPQKMWKLASKFFAQEPYSNGSDAKYEAVKAKLRETWGKDVINDMNKERLKSIAKNRGKDVELNKANAITASYYVAVSDLDGDIKKVIDVDRVVSVNKNQSVTTNLMLKFGAPFYFSYLESFRYWENVEQQKPYDLRFESEELRDTFAASLLWVQQYSRERHAKRTLQMMSKAMLGGGQGRIWKISYRSTSRWWPHTLVWRVQGDGNSGAIAVFRDDLPDSTPLREKVVVRFAPNRLKSIGLLSRILWPDQTVTPTGAEGFQFAIQSSKGTRRIGVIFGDEATARDFLDFAVKHSTASNGIELSSAVASIRDDEVTAFLPETFLGGQKVVDEVDDEKNAPVGFNEDRTAPSTSVPKPPAPTKKNSNFQMPSMTTDGGLTM